MLRHHFKVFFRNFLKNKIYTFINVVGLAIGIAGAIMIFLWVDDETRYDQFHKEGEHIYQVFKDFRGQDDKVEIEGIVQGLLAPTLKNEFPEITESIRLSWDSELLFKVGDQYFKRRGFYADSSFFKAFSFNIVEGNSNNIFPNSNTITISEDMAKSLFGDQLAIGNTVYIEEVKESFQVTGIFKNIPQYSSLQFDYVISFKHFIGKRKWLEDWGNSAITSFVQVNENTNIDALNEKIAGTLRKYFEYGKSDVFLYPFKDLYLKSDFRSGRDATGRIQYILLFSFVGIFTLLIACINFMNLATARASYRAKEVGVRKVNGARFQVLVTQFLSEAFLITVFATVLSIILVELVLPNFNTLTGKNISIPYANISFLLLLTGVVVLVSLISGGYPAFYLSAFNPANVLKGKVQSRQNRQWLRKGLVIFQFTLSIVLIIGTIGIYRQIHFIQNINIGLNRENVIYFEAKEGIATKRQTFKETALQYDGIESIAYGDHSPLLLESSSSGLKWEGKPEDFEADHWVVNTNYDYFKTMGMELKEGRSFSRDFATDSMGFLLNETAIQKMNLEDPIGKKLRFWGGEGEIIGIVKDFHHRSVHNPIEPVVFRFDPEMMNYVFVRIKGEKATEALQNLNKVFNQFNEGLPFDYKFLDQEFESMYKSETVIGELANYFAIMAILISCLGLFGLAAFTAEQRTKEIGVRKVMGASVSGLVFQLSGTFTKLVGISFVFASPLAYYFMSDWLKNYAYKANLGIEVFLFAGFLTLFIAWLTVSYQSLRAAMKNPVDTLRYE